MQQRVKQRLVGAVILVALGVIFIPMLLKGPVERKRVDLPVEIPPQPRVNPVPDLPVVSALHKPAPGRHLAERPRPVTTTTPPSASKAKSAPSDRSPASTPAAQRPPASEAAAVDSHATAGESSRNTAPTRSTGNSAQKEGTGETATSAWAVQVGSFQDRDNAWTLKQELRKAGFSVYVEQVRTGHKPLYRVRVGPVIARSEAERLAARLHKDRGLNGLVVEK